MSVLPLSAPPSWASNSQYGDIRGGASGRWLGHEDGTFMKEISAILKEAPQSFPAPRARKGEVCHPEEGRHPTMLVPSFQTCSLQNYEK